MEAKNLGQHHLTIGKLDTSQATKQANLGR
jgi:hypothetical protein